MIFANKLSLKKTLVSLKLDILQIIILYIGMVISVFGFGNTVGTIYIGLVLFLFFNSKKDYFWLAFFFILATKPANFFAAFGGLDSVNRLPIINIASGISFASEDLIVLSVFVKAFIKGGFTKSVFYRPVLSIFLFGIFILLASFFTDAASLKSKVPFIRNFASYLVVFALPVLFRSRIDLYRFGYLLLPFTFFFLFSSVYYFVVGDYLVNALAPGSINIAYMWGGAQRLLVHGGGHYFLLFTFVFSLILLLSEHKGSNYFTLTALSSYLSIVMTATRIWFVVFTLILIVFIVKYSFKSLIKNSSTVVILILIASFFAGGALITGIDNTWDRLSSVFTIGEEDSQATATIEDKATGDLPYAINGFLKNPIFGVGFTSYYIQHGSDDVGNFNLLQEGGVIGFLFFVFFWVKYFKILKNNRVELANNKEYMNISSLFKFMFIGLLIAHFTTNQFFAFSRFDEDIWLLAVILVFTEYYKPYEKLKVIEMNNN